MKKRVIKNTERILNKLYEQYKDNLTPEILSKKANLSYITAEEYIKLKKRGFSTSSEYKKYCEKNIKKQPPERKIKIRYLIGNLIEIRLYVLNKNQTWLAKELGVTRCSISHYTLGKTIPGKSLRSKLFKVLGLPYKNIESLLKST